MNRDIRIELSFITHRKRKKLFSLLGPQGVLSLIDFWLSTAQNRPKGILTGMDETDISLDAQWPGDPKEFCSALITSGFLDKECLKMHTACNPQCGEQCYPQCYLYKVHDWGDHQPFAFYAEERSNRAREAAIARWDKRQTHEKKQIRKGDAQSMQGACDQHTKGNAPSPSPYPKKDKVAYSDEFLSFWKVYPGRNGDKAHKSEAWEEFKKISPNPELLALILKNLDLQKRRRQNLISKSQFAPEFPDACRWLKKRRWEDETTEIKSGPGKPAHNPIEKIEKAEKSVHQVDPSKHRPEFLNGDHDGNPS